MALDEAMLRSGALQFRVYQWDGVWVSLGRGQDPSDTLAGEGRWVKRPTGGSAVLHGHDVTVSIAMPLHRVPGVGETYRRVTRPLIEALQTVGVHATLSEDLGLRATISYEQLPDCFATTTRNDIIDPNTGEKICGCALRRTREAVLLQASIPVAEPLVEPGSVIRGGVRTVITPLDPIELERALQRVLMQ